MTWKQINEKIWEMEGQKERDDEWKKEWNTLIDESRKIAGCLKREKYEEPEGEKRREEKTKRRRKKGDVVVV